MRRKFFMSTVTYEKGKWTELGKELEKVVIENNLKTKQERKSLSVLFKDFAKEKDTTASSAQFYYYNNIKSKLEEPMNVDESINNYVNSVTTDLRDPRSFYKIGETLEVEITSIHDFGVFGKTKEGFDGLIHVSEITGRQYVDLPDDYFYIGEKVRVKVKRLDNDGKMSFSTRALGGKEKINPAFKDIANSNIQDTETVVPKVEKVEPLKVEESKIEEQKVEIPKTVPTHVHSNDRDNIINFIKRYSDNNVSQKALSDIDEMVSEYGVFQTTISLMEAIRDLDISSFITELTKEKISGECLWRS
jgi:predicted RNA-binding protein with RPS1 domain